MWSDNETTIDLLGFQHLSNAVVTIIKNDELLPATIGIYGDWGSGKSSLLQIVQNELKSDAGIAVVTFNGWLFEGYEDAKTALMGSIIEELIDQKRILPAMLIKAKKLLSRIDGFKLAGGLAKVAIGLSTGFLPLALGGGSDFASLAKTASDSAKNVKPEDLNKLVKEKSDNEEDENLRRSIRQFRKDFSTLLDESKIKKLVVIIDDLDRCLPDTIIETLEAIKLFLFVEKTAFILGADERLVKYAVRKRFPELPGERVEVGRDYLEKLVQFPVRVPPLGRSEMETYIGLLFAQISDLTNVQQDQARARALEAYAGSFNDTSFNLAEAEKLFGDRLPASLKERLSLAGRVAPLLSASLKGNPRQCKRFLNTLLMRLQMAEFRKIPLQQRILSKLMLLEYFKPESFRRLAEIQAEEEGKPRQLMLMEKGVNLTGNPEPENTEQEQNMNAFQKVEAGEDSDRRGATDDDSGGGELEGEFKTWLNLSWIRDWLKLEPLLADVDLRPYFYFSRDLLISPLSGASQRMSPIAQEIFADLTKDSEAVQNIALIKAADLSLADAVAVFEALSQRAIQEEEFNTTNRALMRLFDWAQYRPELRGELVALMRRLPDGSIATALIPKLLGLSQGHESENAAYELLEKWSTGSNSGLAKIAKSRLSQRGRN